MGEGVESEGERAFVGAEVGEGIGSEYSGAGVGEGVEAEPGRIFIG